MAGIYNGPPRGGTRGGQDQFSWDSVKNDKDREFYLGHSLKAPVGRWQKGKDLLWYTRGKAEGHGTVNQELAAVKAREDEMMMQALGIKPKTAPVGGSGQQLDRAELSRLLSKEEAEGDAVGQALAQADRVKGLGYGHGVAAASASREVMEGEGLNDPRPPLPPVNAPEGAGPSGATGTSGGAGSGGGQPALALSAADLKLLRKAMKARKKEARKGEKEARKGKKGKEHKEDKKTRKAKVGGRQWRDSPSANNSDGQPQPSLRLQHGSPGKAGGAGSRRRHDTPEDGHARSHRRSRSPDVRAPREREKRHRGRSRSPRRQRHRSRSRSPKRRHSPSSERRREGRQ